VLTGVNTEFEGDTMTLAAADGFRLAVYKLPLAVPVNQRSEVIIPSRTFAEVGRLLVDQEDPVEIIINQARSQALFRFKNVELVTQLVQGTFPKYSQLIPQSHKTRSLVNVGQFLRAARTASIFARDGSGIVRLVATPGSDLTPGKLVVSAKSEEVGEDIGEIDAAVEGEEAKVAFNSKYLIDVLSVIRDEQVVLETTSPSSPGLIKPVGKDNYLHVVMPMFVQW
jgi:DNA polymerase-3 subunit beta